MAKSSGEVTIYGAGMSGLIAAINLAREGYSVTVHDREPGYGGSRLYNPSTHVTPLDPVRTSEYIGVDITPVFHQVRACPSYFHDRKVMLPVYETYAVERGARPTSLDTLLFEECGKLPVKFEFNSPLGKEDLADLPPNTILACGLSPGAYEMLDMPYLRWYGFISRGRISLGSYAWLWWNECNTEYGYFSTVNDYYFNLLFGINPVTRGCLEKYKRFMVRNEGIEHRDWDYVTGAVPIGSPDNPRLFWNGSVNGAILCGTLSGAMDPMMWFGISGALVTGKVAALAVTDPGRAAADFERFTRRYRLAYAIKNRLWYPWIRPNIPSGMERLTRAIGTRNVERLARLTTMDNAPVPFAIPGFSHLSCG